MAEYTPMMKQYFEIKEQYSDCLLFFRLGDFYEMFFDDAHVASKILDIALTGRDCGQEERAPMCGVPFHSADGYITKLIREGYKVAVCEQVEDASEAKGIVKRDVVRVVTEGTIIDSMALDEQTNNYLCSLYISDDGAGIAFVDITTGELNLHYHSEGDTDIEILNDMAKYNPVEVITPLSVYENERLMKQIADRFNSSIRNFYDWAYEPTDAEERISRQFEKSLSELGILDKIPAVCALGGLVMYLEHTQKMELANIKSINLQFDSDSLQLDVYTIRNLEIIETYRDKKTKGSLLNVINKTKTPMGSRLLRQWIVKPLINPAIIQNRLNAVDELMQRPVIREEIVEALSKIVDIERFMGKVVYKTATCRDLISLANSFAILPSLKTSLQQCNTSLFERLLKHLDTLSDMRVLIQQSINEDAPFGLREGNLIKDGYDEAIDEKRRIKNDGTTWINQIAQEEKEKTGIKNLKVGYNKIFGYFLEVTKSYANQVPDYFIRKQTLANSERYIVPKIKEIEEMIAEASTNIVTMEYDLFCTIRDKLGSQVKRVKRTSSAIAVLDVLCSFATVAEKNGYVRPNVNMSDKIEIRDGRHPVVENMLQDGLFIPNDVNMDNQKNQISVITGPNMAGKSTYMRQVALIVLMAQMGSFVPASSAEIGIVDKIFTRIGASDDLSAGESTFMVEMKEVAYILGNATKKSLIILDEIGRGTSTYDGLSIAWAVVEHIADKKKCGAKTLFATHYHELTELEREIDNVKNFCIAVKKNGDDITFLRKIISGGADDSYGVEVALLAGVNSGVIKRAKEIIKTLESQDINKPAVAKIKTGNSGAGKETSSASQQGFLNDRVFELLQDIKNLDINNIEPEAALAKLFDLYAKAKNV